VINTNKAKLEQFVEILEASKLTLDKLPTFDHDLLKSVGITDVNDRLIILNSKKDSKLEKNASKITLIEILVEFDGKNKLVKVENLSKETIEKAVCESFSVKITDYELHVWNEK
jgi:uncharacterized membrane-anchored protein